MKIRGKLISSFGAVTLAILLVYAGLVYISFTESLRRDQDKIYHYRVKAAVLSTERSIESQIRATAGISYGFKAGAPENRAVKKDPSSRLIRGYLVVDRDSGKKTGPLAKVMAPAELAAIPADPPATGVPFSPEIRFGGNIPYLLLQETVGGREALYLFQMDRKSFIELLRQNLLLDQSKLLLAGPGGVKLELLDRRLAPDSPIRSYDTSALLKESGPAEAGGKGFVNLDHAISLFAASDDFFGLHLYYLLPRTIFYRSLARLKNRVVAATLILAWIAVWVILIISYRLSKPVVKLARVTNDMIAYNYQTPFEFAISNDEIGELARSLETMRQKIEQSVTRDALTMVYNRRYLMHMFKMEFHKALRGGWPLSCIMLDIDHFKKINDSFGHQAGDDVLQAMGRLLTENTREYDIVSTVARYGGEEFVVLLPGTPTEAVMAVAERLRDKVARNSLPHGIRCTISVGIALLDVRRHESPDLLLAEADQALYRAKKQGRNRVVLFN